MDGGIQMKYIITQLKRDEALVESMRGNTVFMIDLSVFEKIKDVYFMSVGEIVSTSRDHDVVFIMLQEDSPFFGSDQNV